MDEQELVEEALEHGYAQLAEIWPVIHDADEARVRRQRAERLTHAAPVTPRGRDMPSQRRNTAT
jgi:hypothetical protein